MKLTKYVLYALFIITAIITILFFVNSEDSSMVSLMLNWSYILCFVCVVLAILLPLFFRNGKGFKSTLIKVVAFLVVGLIAYLFATGAPLEVMTTETATPTQLKFADTIIIATGILLVLGLLSIVFGGLIGLFRKN